MAEAAALATSGKVVIRNIGLLLSGDIDRPILEADTIVVQDGRIAAVGREKDLDAAGAANVIDCRGTCVAPGLIDTPLMSPQLRAVAPTEGMWRLVKPREVAETVWRAYHEDVLHWYVPPELRDFHRQVVDQPEQVREERTELYKMLQGLQ